MVARRIRRWQARFMSIDKICFYTFSIILGTLIVTAWLDTKVADLRVKLRGGR